MENSLDKNSTLNKNVVEIPIKTPKIPETVENRSGFLSISLFFMWKNIEIIAIGIKNIIFIP